MIYCRHCNRPSARESGPCPHCGNDLGGAAGTPEPDLPAPPPAPAPASPAAGAPAAPPSPDDDSLAAVTAAGGVALDLDPEGEASAGSGMELADDDLGPAPPSMPAFGGGKALDLGQAGDDEDIQLATIEPPERSAGTTAEPSLTADRPIEEKEIGLAAGFGSPAPGPIGAIKYALRVYGRLKDLATEQERALETSGTAVQRQRAIAAELGRKAHAAETVSDAAKPLVARALAADSDVIGAEQRRKGLESEHRARVAALEGDQARAEQEATPLRERVAILSHELEQHRNEQRRIESQLKRAQIELRNLTEMIESRQKAYADQEKPKEERERLLADIADFDKQQPGVRARIDEHRKELEGAHGPVAEHEALLAEAQGQLDDKLAKVDALRREREDLIRSYDAARGQVVGQIENEESQAESAWAAVGVKLLEDEVAEGPLADLGAALGGAIERTREAHRKVEVLKHARDSYDRGVVKQAKIIGVLGAAVVVGLIVAIGVALT